MPSYVTPKINTEFVFYVTLISQSDTKLLQNTPTIASGDFTVSTDGSAYTNLDTIPAVDPAAGEAVKVTLSAAEMNGDNVLVQWEDAAGSEWVSGSQTIQTTANQIDDLGLEATLTTMTATLATIITNIAAVPAAVWAYATRTLTQSATSISDATAAGSITRMRGNTWSFTVTLGAITGYTDIVMTARQDRSAADTASIFQIRKTTGLVYINGAAAGTAGNATVTVNDEATGSVTFTLSEAETVNISPCSLPYDIAVFYATGTKSQTPESGTFTISTDVTQAIV